MESPEHRRQFPPTRWSLILSIGAGSRCGAGAMPQREAGEFCQLYWPALYGFARRRGLTPQDAEDATQDFFAVLLGGALLGAADPARGKMRTYLMKAFSRHLIDRARREGAQKRGGAAKAALSAADRDWVEAALSVEDRSLPTPETFYDRNWALSAMRHAAARVAEAWAQSGKAVQFEAMRPFLNPGDDQPPAAEVAATLGVTPALARQMVHRLRLEFRSALRATVAETLADPADDRVDEELRALKAALSA